MDSHSDFLEILILGAIAVFLIYRLVSTLGQRSGYEQPRSKTIFDMPEEATPEGPKESLLMNEDQKNEEVPDAFKKEIDQLKKIDRDFSWTGFMEGATAAYEMVIEAFAKGDTDTLSHLLSKDVYSDFAEAIKARETEGKTLQTTLIRIVSVECEKIEINGAEVSVQLRYVSEQTHVMRNNKGVVIEGSSQQVEEIIDVWTFARHMRAANPNWTLVAIEV
ncbi:MAG: Tim44/TimA family putative adaptor protein [Alphaproteobacteria bacterium]|jgi:predicted lipid-binding transport protein (Tim44 family)|nr:Tim44/TimA family putative adaptor protein [Alphaproteobacteria bacterium]